MRAWALLVFCVGCGPEAMRFEARGSLEARTLGVELGEDGRTAWAGMLDTTCEIDAANGAVVGDGDVPGTGDRLLDARGRGLLVEAAGLAYRIEIGGLSPVPAALSGVRGGVLLADGRAALVHALEDGCGLSFGLTEVGAAVPLSGLTCDAPVAVAARPGGDRVFVSDGRRTVLFADGEVREIAALAGADRLVYDGFADRVYAARVGDGLVQAVHAEDGAAIWASEHRGEIVGMDVLADDAAVAVVVEDGGDVELAALDVNTGGQRLRRELPEPAIPVGGLGEVDLALVTPDAVYFYGVDVGSSLNDDPSFGESSRPQFEFAD